MSVTDLQRTVFYFVATSYIIHPTSHTDTNEKDRAPINHYNRRELTTGVTGTSCISSNAFLITKH